MKPGQPTNHPMRLAEESIALLDTIMLKFPPAIPERAKLRLIDKMAMHGTGIARQRGNTAVTVDDIMMGIHQFLPPEHLNLIRMVSGISPEQMAKYQQACRDLDYVPLDAFLSNLKAIAKTCGVEIQGEKLLPALECYKEPFEYDTVYIKTTNRDSTPREFFQPLLLHRRVGTRPGQIGIHIHGPQFPDTLRGHAQRVGKRRTNLLHFYIYQRPDRTVMFYKNLRR